MTPAPVSRNVFAPEITTRTTYRKARATFLSDTDSVHDDDSNVSIRQLTIDEAGSIVEGRRPERGWASDFPAEGDVTSTRYATFSASSVHEPWHAPWLILLDGLVVGTLGFKGEPVVDILEVGYSVVPSVQRRGVATRALAQLLDQVRGRGITVKADTAKWNTASQSVLRHLHFTEIEGPHGDGGENDTVIFWQRSAQ